MLALPYSVTLKGNVTVAMLSSKTVVEACVPPGVPVTPNMTVGVLSATFPRNVGGLLVVDDFEVVVVVVVVIVTEKLVVLVDVVLVYSMSVHA